jgi:SAM-dependent methyltransferase
MRPRGRAMARETCPDRCPPIGPCNLCGGIGDVAAAGHPRLLRCRECGLVTLEKFPDHRELAALYQEDYYREATGERFLAPFEWALSLFARLRARAIIRRQAAPGAILDVGCGRGDLLEVFRARGWRAVGTQISRTAAEAARRRRGVEVILGELPDLDLPGSSFHAVTFFHVLEHLDRPRAYLEEARRLLVDGGLLVIEIPNFSTLGFRILGTRNFCMDFPRHLVFFTPRSLATLVESCGFTIEGRSFFLPEYSIFTTLQNLLNLLLPGEPNRFYRALSSGEEGRRSRKSPLTWLHALAGVTLAPLAMASSLLGLAGTGNTLRIYCRKEPIREPVPA